MSKFAVNDGLESKTKSKAVTNLAGGKAYAQDNKTALVSMLVTSMIDDTYYESASEGMARLQNLVEELVQQGEADFVAKAAIAARTQFHLRSVTHLAAGLLGPHARGETWKRSFYKAIVQRPDDAVEILSAYLSTHGRPIPNAMKRGLADAIHEMDEYQLAKYRGGSGKLKLIDVVNMVRPVGTPAIGKLMTGTLKPADTWEVGLSEAGDDAEKKAAVWKRLIDEHKLGYMAALRNIRNVAKQAPDSLDDLLDVIRNPELIAKSRQLPFRFWSAMKVANQEGLSGSVIRALDTALDHACANVPKLSGRTLVAVDFSGSMDSMVAGRNSTTSCREIASLLAIVIARHNDSDFVFYGDRACKHKIHPTDSIMGQMQVLAGFNQHGWGYHSTNTAGAPDNVGHGTNIGAVFASTSTKYDRILFLEDEQSWGHEGGEYSEYKRRTGADPFIYDIDLRGHGTSTFNPGNPRFFQLAGFSDKIFDLIGMCEMGTNALIENVAKIEL